MAISSGVFSTFLPHDAVSLIKPSSPSLPFAVRLSASPSVANLGLKRTAICATASSQPATGEPRRRGIMKPRPVTPEMADLVGASEIPRTEALKRIWAHIKRHDLQDPENKKIIVCDEKLKKIFGGKDRVGFLEIAGLITPHFLR